VVTNLLAGWLLFTILASSFAATQTASTSDFRREDGQVLRAVLDGVIIPQLGNSGSRVPAPILLVEDQTISLRGTGKIPDR
jgi:hypothetical protein